MHFPLNEVKGVSSVKGNHAKEAILGLGALQAPVEGDLSLCSCIAPNIGSLPSENWFVQMSQLAPNLAKILSDPKAVCDGTESVL